MTLVERSEELSVLDGALADCHLGVGSVVLVSGSVANGKTELLSHLVQRVSHSGAILLKAACSRTERDFPLGVVGQLLESAPLPDNQLHRLRELTDRWATSGTEENADTEGIPVAMARLIFDLCRSVLDLANRSPVVIVVDDVQFADPASLEWLLYLVRRLRSTSLLMALAKTTGPGPEMRLPSFAAELNAQPHVRRIRLGPLSPSGVNAVLTNQLGASGDKLTAECCAITGGNPLLLRGLIEDNLAAADPIPAQRTGRPVVGDAFREAVLACVHRCGPTVLQGARGLAALDTGTGPALLHRLVGVESQLADQINQVLEKAGLVRRGRFVSGIARQAVLDDLPAADRTALFLRAAELLQSEGAPPAVVAERLLAAGEMRLPWGVNVLRSAAEQALAEDRTEVALEQLRLARRSCTDPALRASIGITLAQVEWRLNPAAATVRLPRLLSEFSNGNLGPAEVIFPISYLLWQGRFAEAVPAIDQLTSHADEPGPHLQAFQLWLASSFPTMLAYLPAGQPRLADPTAGPQDTITLDGRLRAPEMLAAVLRYGPGERVVTEAERVLQGCPLDHTTVLALQLALATLVYCDRQDQAARWCDLLLREAASRHAPSWHAMFTATRAGIALRQGDLCTAETLARSALSLISEHAWGVAIGEPLGTLVHATTALGKFDEAAKALMVPIPQAVFETRWGLYFLHARGTYHLAVDQPQAALSDFLTCGELMTEWNIDLPALVPWRGEAAYVYLRLGQPEQARRLAKAQLDRPGARHARTHGISLRVLAACSELRHRPQLLQKASEELLASGDTLEFAGALADLGETYHRLGDAERARMTVRRARHIAKECPAESLRARLFPHWMNSPAEPVAAPASPETELTALSEAERRVATLAAMGHTNREIARKLYITVSTVEQHLTRVYRKLDVRRRTDLPFGLQARLT